MMAVYAVVLSFLALMRYYTFRTYIDLGIFDQAFSSTLKGRFFYETPDLVNIPSGIFLGTHFAPIVLLLLPIYAIHPSPETLLILQTPFIALGALPVFLIARHLLRNANLSLGLAALYLVNPGVQSLNLFDFHVEAFLPFFIGMAYYCFLTRKWRAYLLFLGLSLITIEFASILAAAMSIVMLISDRERLGALFSIPRKLLVQECRPLLFAICTILLASADFYLSIVISGIIAGAGASPQRVLSGFFPDLQQWIDAGFVSKMIYWVILLGTLLFMPLKAATRALMAAPWLFVTLVATNGAYYAIGYQYSGAFVAPYLIIALVHAIDQPDPVMKTRSFITTRFPAMLFLCITLSPMAPWAQYHVPGIVYEEGLPIFNSHDSVIYEAMSLIPSNASVLTQNELFSHFTNRPNAYLYLPNNNTKVDYIFGDNTSRWYASHVFGQESISQSVSNAMSANTYTVLKDQDGVILLKRNA
jgi:uncharacterized membrane protein